MKITIHERAVSWNDLYSIPHWSKRAELANRWHYMVREAIPLNARLFTQPVHIVITGVFRSRPQDPDNICDKLMIDGLKGLIIEEDDYEHVLSTTTQSVKGKNDRVEIEIFEHTLLNSEQITQLVNLIRTT